MTRRLRVLAACTRCGGQFLPATPAVVRCAACADGRQRTRLRQLELVTPTDYPAWAARERPRTRGDCVDAPRPCPWATCVYHLSIHADREPVDLAETCALDIADRGGATLEEVGAALHVTRERARQIEVRALRRLVKRSLLVGLGPGQVEERETPWGDVALSDGEPGGAPHSPSQTASVMSYRGADWDEETAFLERIDTAYERESRNGVGELPPRREGMPFVAVGHYVDAR